MRWLLDTNILIDHLRDKEDAVTLLNARIADSAISSLSVAELYQGVREGTERVALAALQSALTILPVTPEIAQQGGLYARQYRNSHGAGLIDCLLAATAKQHGLNFVTLNSKHFPMLSEVEVPYVPS
jgi:predicted nucleic acid-binding protein